MTDDELLELAIELDTCEDEETLIELERQEREYYEKHLCV